MLKAQMQRKNIEKACKNKGLRTMWAGCKTIALRLFVLMLLVVFVLPEGAIRADETAEESAAVSEEDIMNAAPAAEVQPSNITCYNNVTVKFYFGATGNNLKYRWQASKDGGNTWNDSSISGYNTDTLSVAATTSRSGYKFRCIVTDKKGNTLTSEAARLNVLATGKSVAINETNFPDKVFRNYVSEYFDTDENGSLSVSEIAEAKEIEIYDTDCASVEGICLLDSLVRISFGCNQITDADL